MQTVRNGQGGNRGASKRVGSGAEDKAEKQQEGMPRKGWGPMAARQPNRANRVERCAADSGRWEARRGHVVAAGPRRHRRGRCHLFPNNHNPPTSHSEQTRRQPPPPPNTLGMQTHSTRHTQQTAAAPHTASHTLKTGSEERGRAEHGTHGSLVGQRTDRKKRWQSEYEILES